MKNIQINSVITFGAFSLVPIPLRERKKVPNWNSCGRPVYIIIDAINTTNITTTTTSAAATTIITTTNNNSI
jgi:hypothetical protein